MYDFMITIFTPTYNRASLLRDVYESLLLQSLKDFEWVIVDDGSTDDTQTLFQAFSSSERTCFPIRYFYQENGGKHRAINRGVKEAKGELFLILDSDDVLLPDAVKIINDYYLQIKEDFSFCGVCGRIAHRNGSLIGSPFAHDVMDMSYLECRYNRHIKGDMLEVIRTSIMKNFPFPEIEGEKFCPEALIWNRIGCKYKMRYFNKVVYQRDYLEHGLTDKIVKIRMNSPEASMTTYAELLKYNIVFKQKVKAAINYWRFRFCAPKTKIKKNISVFWCWTIPFGYLLHILDLKRA